jgi:hypothetical protein
MRAERKAGVTFPAASGKGANVGKVTIGFGVALIAVSAGAVLIDALRGARLSGTAAIPAAIGLTLAVLGYVAVRSEKARMHVMHAAVIVSLLGFLAAAVRFGMTLPTAMADGSIANPVAFTAVLLLGLICAAHVALSVKSFIDARRSRKQAGSTPS